MTDTDCTTPEVWKAIPDYPGYEVSDMGRVRSYHNAHGGLYRQPHILKQAVIHAGRLRVTLYSGNKPKHWCVHQLVLAAFKGPAPEGMIGCHHNGNHLDNRPENLRWDYPAGNFADRVRLGECRGEKNGQAKLTPDTVREIRRLYASGDTSHDKLAAKFDVGASTIGRVLKGERWAHVV